MTEQTPETGTAPAGPANDVWAGLRFLLGEWIGEGGEVGDAGEQASQGSGWFSFALDLQDQIMVRRNHARYPATADKPEYKHDDLMIIYPERAGDGLRAIYFDNEGHVIEYIVRASPAPSTATSSPVVAEFTSQPSDSSPGFRLTYVELDNRRLDLKFEVAAPGEGAEFSPYLEARCLRRETV